MNGDLEKRAEAIILGSETATAQEKLTLLLAMVNDIRTRQNDFAKLLRRDPLFVVPARWAKVGLMFYGAWFAWVTVSHLGLPISLEDILRVIGLVK